MESSHLGTRPIGRLEMVSWLYMRLSGILLLVMAVYHLLLMHYGIGVENLSFDVVAARWESLWWRLYDLVLLVFALSHGVNGLRIVIGDYVRSDKWRFVFNTVLALVFSTLIVMGVFVIVTFEAAT